MRLVSGWALEGSADSSRWVPRPTLPLLPWSRAQPPHPVLVLPQQAGLGQLDLFCLLSGNRLLQRKVSSGQNPVTLDSCSPLTKTETQLWLSESCCEAGVVGGGGEPGEGGGVWGEWRSSESHDLIHGDRCGHRMGCGEREEMGRGGGPLLRTHFLIPHLLCPLPSPRFRALPRKSKGSTLPEIEGQETV